MLKRFVIIFIFSTSILSVNMGQNFGLISVSVANLRKAPIYTSELVSQAILGTPVKIIQEKGDWVQIITPDRLGSWIKMNCLARLNEADYLQWKHQRRVITVKESGTLYTKADFQSAPVSNFVAGSILVLKKETPNNGFISVELPDHTKAYLLASGVEDFDQFRKNIHSFSPSIALRFAEQLMGRPYLWGGKSPFGMDCSGFIRNIFENQGILLPRNASEQALCGRNIPKDSTSLFQVGDLMFFRSRPERGNKVTHVAMYIGKNCIIQSSTKVKVNSFNPIDSMYDKDLQNRLLLVKRFSDVSINENGISNFLINPYY